MLTASGAKTLSDLNGDKLKSAVTMLKTYSNLDRETRQLLSGSLRATLRIPCFSSVSRLYDTTFLSALQAHSAKFIVLRD